MSDGTNDTLQRGKGFVGRLNQMAAVAVRAGVAGSMADRTIASAYSGASHPTKERLAYATAQRDTVAWAKQHYPWMTLAGYAEKLGMPVMATVSYHKNEEAKEAIQQDILAAFERHPALPAGTPHVVLTNVTNQPPFRLIPIKEVDRTFIQARSGNAGGFLFLVRLDAEDLPYTALTDSVIVVWE